MTQVVTNENVQQLIETGKVEEYKEPEKAAAVEEKSEDVGTTPEDPKRFAARMAEKHASMKDAEEFAEIQYLERRAAEKRADELEAKLKEAESRLQPVAVKVIKPEPKDFADAFAYAEALADYKVETKLSEERARVQQEGVERENERVKNEFIARINTFRKETPDFDKVMSGSEQIVPQHIQQYLVESEDGPRIAYHFARNPDELERLARLSPIRAIAELGKLETAIVKPKVVTMTESKTVAAANVSKAPAPIETLGGGTTGVQLDPSKMTTKEYLAYARANRKNERSRKVHH